MVQRYDNDDEPKKKNKVVKEEVEEEKVEEEKPENKIPMIPHYEDLILGEIMAIRLMLEKKLAN